MRLVRPPLPGASITSADFLPDGRVALGIQVPPTGERLPGVDATPGKGTHVPLYILGSSMFGARLAALLGLPFALASHFAPDALQDAVAAYRRDFRPSAQLEQPYVIAGVNVIAADTSSAALEQYLAAKRNRVRSRLGRGQSVTDAEADALLDSPAGQHLQQMFRFAAVGTPAEVREYIEAFARYADADELIVAHQSPTTEARLRSVALLADARPTRSQARTRTPFSRKFACRSATDGCTIATDVLPLVACRASAREEDHRRWRSSRSSGRS